MSVQEITSTVEIICVEIFKTNVVYQQEADELIHALSHVFSDVKFNFDLDDCDRILRLEGSNLPVDSVVRWMIAQKYCCELLD